MGKTIYDINHVREIVEGQYGWTLLDSEYKGHSAKYKVMCQNGHTSYPQLNNLKSKKRTCKFCNVGKPGNNLNYTIEDCQNFAKSNNLILNSNSINNKMDELDWTCKNCNTSWSTSFANMLGRKNICLHCDGWELVTIERLQEIAKSKGGVCLSSTYRPSEKQEFKCSLGHQFDKDWAHLSRGQWCPTCNDKLSSESIVKLYLETLLNKKFPKIKPKWLETIDGSRLELDGYCQELGLAFEHHGPQHYEVTKFFHQNDPKKLENQQIRDQLKLSLCEKNGVKVLVVPTLGEKIQVSDLKDFIKTELIKLDIELPSNYDEIEIDINQINHSDKLDCYHELAEKNLGKIRLELMEPYVNINSIVWIECSKGTVSSKKGSLLKEGFWCTEPCCKKTGKHKCPKTGRFVSTK